MRYWCRASRISRVTAVDQTASSRAVVQNPGTSSPTPVPFPKVVDGRGVQWSVDLRVAAESQAALQNIVPMLPRMTSATGAEGAIAGPLQLHSPGGCRAPRPPLMTEGRPAFKLLDRTKVVIGITILCWLSYRTCSRHEQYHDARPHVGQAAAHKDSIAITSSWTAWC